MRKHLTRMFFRDNIVDQTDELTVRVERLERTDITVTAAAAADVIVYDEDGKPYTLHVKVLNDIPRLLLREYVV